MIILSSFTSIAAVTLTISERSVLFIFKSVFGTSDIRGVVDYVDLIPVIIFFIADIRPQTIPFSNR